MKIEFFAARTFPHHLMADAFTRSGRQSIWITRRDFPAQQEGD